MIERILLIVALAHVVAGLALAMLPIVPSVHSSLASAIFGADKASEEVKFLVSVFGPTVASWGILFFALVRAHFRNPARGSWWALVLSVVIWAPLDSVLCIHYGYGLTFPVALNAAIAVLLLGLLLGARNQRRAGLK